jgi:hypothetical protein
MFDDMDNEALLSALDTERCRYTECDEDQMRSMITELTARGVYPEETVPGNPNTVWQMVRGWGARWFDWGEVKSECPKCGADLLDRNAGPPFRRVIGIYDSRLDRTVGWRCPDCSWEW